MQPTRRQILDYLRRYGKGSVRELGDLLGLTSTGIRQHLTILERDGLIEGHEERGRVGRPALVYTLTDLGDALYPKKYATLASLILDQVRETSGDEGVRKLLERAAEHKAQPYLTRMARMDLAARVTEVARIIEAEGCLVSATFERGVHFLNRLTCPYPDVARNHSDLCYLDSQFVSYLLNAPVLQEARLVEGAPACVYRIEAR
jgi:DeoR family transcriptional regulator, suf operon transcriptional repressor